MVGLPASSRTFTISASKLLPAAKEPTCFSKPQTAAPPAVARYNNEGIDNCLLANEVDFADSDDAEFPA